MSARNKCKIDLGSNNRRCTGQIVGSDMPHLAAKRLRIERSGGVLLTINTHIERMANLWGNRRTRGK